MSGSHDWTKGWGRRRFIGLGLGASVIALARGARADAGPAAPVALGERLELFIDHFLIEKLAGARLRLHEPRDEGAVLKFDSPWEGGFSAYVTITRDGDLLRAYYRGLGTAGKDGRREETTCCAESRDGIAWAKPEFGFFDVGGTTKNNVILAEAAPVTHNFCPFLDARPGVAAAERYKALGGTMESGLLPWVSEDGLRWRKLRDAPVLDKALVGYPYMFDSQNVPFWSAAEGRYLCYYRVFKDKIRRIVRSESPDFLAWSKPVLMEYRNPDGPAPVEHLYTNQTHPYFRAPHIYVAIAARFMPGRQVLTDEQAKAIGVHPSYFKDTSDAILMTTRPVEGPSHVAHYDRTFLEGFIRGGIGARNWVSRTNYPALNVVQTGPAEMSLYVNQDYAQPTAHMRRYSMRLDGFASLHAGFAGGELITRPFTFSGSRLQINFATSAAGGIRVELQDSGGRSIPGFALADCREQIGNEIGRDVAWKGGPDVSALAGRPIRMRVALKDSDLYAFRFRGA